MSNLKIGRFQYPAILAFTALFLATIACAAPTPPTPSFLEVGKDVGLKPGSGQFGPLWLDWNNDGWLDLIFMNHLDMPSFYVNEKGRFRERLAETGVKTGDWLYPEQWDRHGGSCADFDNDNDVDLFFPHGGLRGETVGKKRDELLENDGQGVFRDVAERAQVLNPHGRARLGAWADFDRDGLVDSVVGNYEGQAVLSKNVDKSRFEDVTAAAGLMIDGPNRPLWLDFDRDGRPDIFAFWPLRAFRQGENGSFRDVTLAIGLEKLPVNLPKGLTFADLENDGDPDLVVISRDRGNVILRNDGGVFTAERHDFGLAADEQGAAAAFGDFDNDLDPDLLVVGTKTLRYFENQDGKLTDRADVALPTLPLTTDSDLSLADFDNDGDLDVALGGAGHFLLRNMLSPGNHWLRLRLVGTRSNRLGLGAVVKVKSLAGSQLLERQHWGDDSVFQSTSCAPLHVGLGRHERVDLEVVWPSGQRSLMNTIAVDRELEVVEP